MYFCFFFFFISLLCVCMCFFYNFCVFQYIFSNFCFFSAVLFLSATRVRRCETFVTELFSMELRRLLYSGAAAVAVAVAVDVSCVRRLQGCVSVVHVCVCVRACMWMCVCLVYVVYFEGTLKVKIDNSYWSGRQFLCWACVQDTFLCMYACVYVCVCAYRGRERASASRKSELNERERERDAE